MPPIPVQPASAAPAPSPAPTPPGFVDANQSGEIPPSGAPNGRERDARPRYSDLLAHLTPPGGEPARPPAPRTEPTLDPTRPGELRPGEFRRGELGLGSRAMSEPGTGSRSMAERVVNAMTEPPFNADPRPADLRPADPRSADPRPADARPVSGETAGRPTSLRSAEPRRYDVPTPNSAPPYPYEGDLDDPAPASAPPPTQQRAAVPLVRPAAPAARRVDWSAPEPPRPQSPAPPADAPALDRPSYDPSSFPRRVSYESGPAAEPSGYVPPPAYASFSSPAATGAGGPAEPGTRGLPQRVPAQPDVPKVPEPTLTEPTAETPELARIATHLRRGNTQPREREEGFDVQAILAAVRGVEGVRDASLRATPSGAHSLRLDLAEGADPAEVSRRVARLLQDRMGLDAAMKGADPSALMPMPTRQRSAPPAPAQASAPPMQAPPMQAPPMQAPPMQAPPPRAPEPEPEVEPEPEPEPQRLAERVRPPREERPVEPRLDDSRGQGRAITRVESREGRREETRDESRDESRGEVVPADDSGPPRPLYPGAHPGPRIVIENVHVNTYGTDASVEVHLAVGGRTASGVADGPAVDGYLLRLCAMATAGAVNDLLNESDHPDGPARCFVEHAASVPFGNAQVAVVVLLLSCNSWVEQLAGSSVVSGDDRHAMVRATLAAVNRRLEALLSQ